jgi:multidrug efflux pump subunit AcrA (membrane-fusion protein)
VPRQGSLRPGLFASAHILVQEREDVVCVPTNAVITFAGLEKVVSVQAGKALEKLVTTGRREANQVEILAGLQAGEPVVLDPRGLRTGQPVTLASGADSRTVARTEKPDRSP